MDGLPLIYGTGIGVRGAGDVNGDGFDDLFVSDLGLLSVIAGESGWRGYVVFSPMADPKPPEAEKQGELGFGQRIRIP